MTRVTMAAMMKELALPDSERVAIRNGYQNLVELGWPTELVTLGMCVEADRRHFDRWADGPTLFGSKAIETIEVGNERSIDPQIHAVIALDPTALDQARAIDRRRKARGLLYGYAILIKDNIEADGPLPTTAGSMALLDNVTHRDAPLVTRLRAATL